MNYDSQVPTQNTWSTVKNILEEQEQCVTVHLIMSQLIEHAIQI